MAKLELSVAEIERLCQPFLNQTKLRLDAAGPKGLLLALGEQDTISISDLSCRGALCLRGQEFGYEVSLSKGRIEVKPT